MARRAGVSRATVSHILNGQGGRFSPETLQRVRRAAEDLGYVPSSAGRSLVKGRSDLVMIVFPFMTMTDLQDIVDVLSEGLAEHGFNTIVQLSGPVGSEAHLRLRHVADSLRPAGIIDLGGLTRKDHEEFRRLGLPVVGTAVDSRGAGSDLALGRVQAEHLVARGFRQVAYASLTDERGHPFDQGRAEATRAVCAENGLPEPYLFGVPLDADGATNALAAMLKSIPAPVGIACFNDDVALAVLHATRTLGLDVPCTIGVLGMGKGPLGQLAEPRLSTVWGDMRPMLVALLDALLMEFGGADRITEVDFASLRVEQGETT
ncbi:LacI family DNA-binding transcriptional regulator [Nocardioides sp. dk4132]|uniref:LacI family DNA-binding transcriptional regulator n=1 Tax=Nocardioides sp. dk4132 TaxID=2662433 RepID=UPI002B217CB9|nr:LacI family DNA-binding transcriptional regulator [Nocardioides sp. dk4132]